MSSWVDEIGCGLANQEKWEWDSAFLSNTNMREQSGIVLIKSSNSLELNLIKSSAYFSSDQLLGPKFSSR